MGVLISLVELMVIFHGGSIEIQPEVSGNRYILVSDMSGVVTGEVFLQLHSYLHLEEPYSTLLFTGYKTNLSLR